MTRHELDPAHHGAAGASSIVGVRRRPPANPERYLRRPRLIDLLDQATAGPITLVLAPAGSGKTSLLVDWCDATSVPTAWLSVDETDRDGGQLWVAAAEALGEVVDGIGSGPAARARRGSASAAAAALVAELESVDHPPCVVLVVDDIHLVDDDVDVVASLARFLNAAPPWLHVVLASRRTPELPLDRLRVRGQLTSVEFAELRFSPAEAEDMLVRLDVALGPDEVVEAVDRAGGWAAGLQLTALARRSVRAQPASMPRVDQRGLLFSDYVWREALSGERAVVVDLLLDTCVARRTNAGLAAALTGREDAGDLLREAEERGLFVTRLGPSGWFEVHGVVRHELLVEARRRSPERVTAMYERAALWFEDAGDVATALEHWILADRPRQALRLLAERVGDLYDWGRAATIERTLALIPLDVASGDLGAMVDFAWCHLLVDKHRFVEAVHEARATRRRLDDVDALHDGRLLMMEAVAATVTGDWAASATSSARAVDLLGGAARSDSLGRLGWNVLAREVALDERWDDDGAALRDIRRELAGDPESRLGYEGIRALGAALSGRPLDALRISAGVRNVASVRSMTILTAELGIAEAIAHRELGERPRALAELASSSPPWLEPVTHAQVLAILQLAELRLDDGDVDAASGCFARAHEYVSAEFAGPGGRAWLARTGTVVSLAAGHGEEARQWAEQVEDPFWGGVSRARVLLAEGKGHDAAEVLEGVAPRCPRHGVVLDLLRARAAGTRHRALEHAARAVVAAVDLGLVQTVAAEGPDVLEMLETQAYLAPPAWLDRVRRAASPHAAASSTDPSLQGERLTERELEVLRFLPSRLTLREIADELFISVNTLKFHLKVIYRKLGATSRGEAAELARHAVAPAARAIHPVGGGARPPAAARR